MSDDATFEFEGDEPTLDGSMLDRRDFIIRAAELTAAAAVASGLTARMAQGAVFGDLATSPLAKAQALALKASTSGSSPTRVAVEGAQAFKGVTLNHTYEAGLQALDPKLYSGPLWKKLTGINVSAVELAHPDLYSKAIAQHIAGSGAYDCLDIEPAWVPSLADGGVIQPIDDLIVKYKYQKGVADLHPLYKGLGTYKGKTWGFFDDGDMLALYYRKDVFGNSKLQKAYKAKYKKALAPPTTWDEYQQIAAFISDQMGPKIYGAAEFRKFGNPGNQFAFFQEFVSNGGKFFNPKTMKSQLVSPAGIKTLEQMVAQNKASMPGNNDLDAVSQWTAWLQGKVAMIFSWPPTGRMSENYSQRAKAINFIPKSTIVGKVGYALMPSTHGEMASGFVKAISSDTKNRDAAYLLIQWMNSAPVSLARTMLPYSLRDPFRISQYKSPLYRAMWPTAKEYLIMLNNAANQGVVNPIMSGAQDYYLSIDRMCTAVWAGADPKGALQKAASEWDSTTQKLGVAKQRVAYQQFLKLAGSYPNHTIAALGKAVHIT